VKWFPATSRTNYSLLRGLAKPADLARRAVEEGYQSLAVTDVGSVSGVVEFSKALREACGGCGYVRNAHADAGKGKCMVRGVNCPAYRPAKLKPVLGVDVGVDRGELTPHRLCLLAQTKKGWESLARVVSAANRAGVEGPHAALSLPSLSPLAGDLIGYSGLPGSELADVIFQDAISAWAAPTYEEAKGFLKDRTTLQKDLLDAVGRHQDCLGRDKFFLAVSLLDEPNRPALGLVAKALRWAAQKTGTKCFAAADPHYARPEDAPDHRALLAIALKTTLDEAPRRLRQAPDEAALAPFFSSNRHYLPTPQEVTSLHPPEEIAHSLELSAMCDDYDITGPPMMPEFPLPAGKTSDEHLRDLCRRGWGEKIRGFIPPSSEPRYVERIKTELEVFQKAGLGTYFLVVEDYCRWAVSRGCLLGRARGSGGGCLTSYLLGIIDLDPVKLELLFERFYNEGRNTPGKTSLPDIDTDFETGRRDDVVGYVTDKYGRDKVGQIATFTRMMGSAAVTDVFRVRGRDFRVSKQVTEHIPDKDRIADELQEMMEEEGEASVLKWALRHRARDLSPWVKQDKDGNLSGPYAKDFEQAVRLEGSKRAMSRHPSGIAISPRVLSEFVPMAYPGGHTVIALEMGAVESIGITKYDILATSVLDKLSDYQRLVRTGTMER
jgi:DNA polymerase-3 subunit alpha